MELDQWEWKVHLRQTCVCVCVCVCFRYTVSAFSECSASCGEGLQTRTVQCVTDGSGVPRVVDDSYCTSQGLTRPHEQKHCTGMASCAEYSVSSFSTVSDRYEC